jgi:hypothetical protein
MLQIATQAVPSQQLQVVLAGQNCQIAIYQKTQGMFVDLNDISVAILARNGVPLTNNYSGFQGNLVIIDTQGVDDPTYEGLGGRFQLVYLTEAEVEQLLQ